MRRQAGFTLIELVMVIVILGILAATAMPKFVDLSGQANTAAGDGGLGALRAAAAISYAQNKAWPTGTTLAAAVSPPGGCAGAGVITLPDITQTYTLYNAESAGAAVADCATAIPGIGAIRKTP